MVEGRGTGPIPVASGASGSASSSVPAFLQAVVVPVSVHLSVLQLSPEYQLVFNTRTSSMPVNIGDCPRVNGICPRNSGVAFQEQNNILESEVTLRLVGWES